MRIVLIGAGNLATQLGLTLAENQHQIIQVFSRTEETASQLANKLYCPYTLDLSEIVQNADLYIIAVRDSAIKEVIENTNFNDHLAVHTAGTVPISVFESRCKNYGVLYPLQTFSKDRRVDFSAIPFFIEANSRENADKLKELANKLTAKVLETNSERRAQAHLAAVFACNFVNHFYFIAEELLDEKNLDFTLLKSLIMETASKAVDRHPKEAQTGPALRNDKKVMEEHLKMLLQNPEWERLYQLVSENIYNNHKI